MIVAHIKRMRHKKVGKLRETTGILKDCSDGLACRQRNVIRLGFPNEASGGDAPSFQHPLGTRACGPLGRVGMAGPLRKKDVGEGCVLMVTIPSKCRKSKMKHLSTGGKGGEASAFQGLPWGVSIPLFDSDWNPIPSANQHQLSYMLLAGEHLLRLHNVLERIHSCQQRPDLIPLDI